MMGEAYRCDRCGEYGDKPEKRIEDYRGGLGTKVPQAKIDEYYLCPSCADVFEQFMKCNIEP